MTPVRLGAALLALAVATLPAARADDTPVDGNVQTFKKGLGGWVGRIAPNAGQSFLDTARGSPKPSFHTTYTDFLKNGLRWYNQKLGWVGDYSVVPSFQFGVDVNAWEVQEGQNAITRDLMVYFLDFHNPPPGYDSISVGVKIGTLQAGRGWQRFTATVPDTTSTTLPEGWVGTGDVDADGNPILPAGRTFAEVMSHVDQVAIQTVRQPSLLVLDEYDVAIDNIYLAAICPGHDGAFTIGDATVVQAARGPIPSPFTACD